MTEDKQANPPRGREVREKRVLVCGSREWTDAEPIFMRLSQIRVEAFKRGESVTLIHGNARGADRLARNIGFGLKFDVRPFYPEWDKYGKGAGRRRNLAMLDEQPDLVLAFQINGSRGTQHTIDEARKRGIPVEVFTPASPDTEESPDA